MTKRKLSVFIDESGDLGEYNEVTDFYVISFVFHDQNNDISGQIEKLTNSMKQYSDEPFAIHTEPLIRREEMYQSYKITRKRRIDIDKKIEFETEKLFSNGTSISYGFGVNIDPEQEQPTL